MTAVVLQPTTTWYLVLASALFVIGATGVLVRRNPLVMFMCIELMLNAVNVAFVAFAHRLGDPTAFKGAAQMVRIHRGEAGVGPCLESGVDHRLDGMALGW